MDNNELEVAKQASDFKNIEVATSVNEADDYINNGEDYGIDFDFLPQTLKTAEEILAQKETVPSPPTSSKLLNPEVVKIMQTKLLKYLKLKKSFVKNMDEQSRLFIFYNLFQYVFTTFYPQYAFLEPADGCGLDYYTLLMIIDKEFYKKLQFYTYQYINYVYQQNLLSQTGKSAINPKKLVSLNKEVSILNNYLFKEEMLVHVLSGNVRLDESGKYIGLIDPNGDPVQSVRQDNLKAVKQIIEAYSKNLVAQGIKDNIYINYSSPAYILQYQPAPTTASANENNVSLNNFMPNSVSQIPTGKVKAYNSEEYYESVNMLNPENYKKLSLEQRRQAAVAIIENYCAQNGVPAPKVEFALFAKRGDNIDLGKNDGSTIYLNLELLTNSGPDYAARLMQTTIHEAHHSVQDYLINPETSKTPEQQKLAEQIIKERFFNNGTSKAYIDYAKRAEEQDARSATIKEMERLKSMGLYSETMQIKLEEIKLEEAKIKQKITESGGQLIV